MTIENATTLPEQEQGLRIVSGGESLDVFEIMCRFRTDGSCEHLIKEALMLLARADSEVKQSCHCIVWAQHGVEHPRGHRESGCAFTQDSGKAETAPSLSQSVIPQDIQLMLAEIRERYGNVPISVLQRASQAQVDVCTLLSIIDSLQREGGFVSQNAEGRSPTSPPADMRPYELHRPSEIESLRTQVEALKAERVTDGLRTAIKVVKDIHAEGATYNDDEILTSIIVIELQKMLSNPPSSYASSLESEINRLNADQLPEDKSEYERGWERGLRDKAALKRMEDLLPLVSQSGLKDSESRVKGVTELCLRGTEALGPLGPTLPVLADRLMGLHNRILQELSERVYLYLPSSECYERKELFGSDVALRFPQANTEITFAGNCFATGNYTACVFHLTRVVEIAARVLVSALGVGNEVKNFKLVIVPAKLATWDQLASALQKGVDRKQANISTNSIRRETYEFYNHAVSQFRNFKDAWRNKTSHKRVTYGEGQAKDIMDNVRQFMLHVSERLREPKGATFE